MSLASTLSGIGMAVGPPAAYADQFISILRKKDSTGFSIDICGVLIIANITRVYYWLAARFETPLLVQSVLMIIAQFALLFVCIRYKPTIKLPTTQEEESLTGTSTKSEGTSRRPFQFWAWPTFGSYLEFAALLVVFHGITFAALHRFDWYVNALGFAALGLEATLPIPQLLVNFQRKSTAGFRMTVLLGWVGGDLVKTIYFFAKDGNSVQFKACAVFQLSVDVLLCIQTFAYRAQTQRDLDEREAYTGPGIEEEV